MYFNSHPHEEDDRWWLGNLKQTNISTHILTKRMTVINSSFRAPCAFQLTSSRRGWRHGMTALLRLKSYFNSHPHEEDDQRLYLFVSILEYFNSHPHEEDDDAPPPPAKQSTIISTHILTKRMTGTVESAGTNKAISTHILTKRMTKDCISLFLSWNISTHILTKRMTKEIRMCTVITNISTHILTKRMTECGHGYQIH